MSKKVTLQEWAAANYEKPKAPKTLRRWARDGWIYPVPEKHGREYVVESNARFIGPHPDPNMIARHYESTAA